MYVYLDADLSSALYIDTYIFIYIYISLHADLSSALQTETFQAGEEICNSGYTLRVGKREYMCSRVCTCKCKCVEERVHACACVYVSV